MQRTPTVAPLEAPQLHPRLRGLSLHPTYAAGVAYRTLRTTHAGGIAKHAGRSTRRYKMLRAAYREECRTFENPNGTIGAHCWLCGKPIDYNLPAGPNGHPEAWNLDHAHPVSTHPEQAEDPANFRPSHADCNERRGDQAPFIELGTPSEDW